MHARKRSSLHDRIIEDPGFSPVSSHRVACRNCGRMIRFDGTCGCPEEKRRTSESAGCSYVFALLIVAALVLCSGCVNPTMRPFAEIEAFAHDGLGQNSYAAGGVTFIDEESGLAADIGPAMRFDLGGEGNLINDGVAGAVFRIRWVK